MFDLKALFKRGVEKELTDVDDYIFMPENIQIEIEGGRAICALNSDGSVDVFYSKQGVTHVRAASRKHPLTAFETEIMHGVYDDIIEDLVEEVNDTLNGKSKYFRNEVLIPSNNTLAFKTETTDDDTH